MEWNSKDTRKGGKETKERKKCTRVVDAIRHFYSARVTISADGGGASRRAEKRRGSARNCTRVVDAIRHFHYPRVTISADRGWR